MITGATGYLGRRLARVAADATAVGSRELDVTDASAVMARFEAQRPDAVVHLAAINPGRGGDEEMRAVNVAGATNVATACVLWGIRLVHVSTDVVHDGSAAPYDDDAPASALDRLGPYAGSKAAGESAVRAVCPAAAIVRTSLIYDLDEPDAATAGFAARLASGEDVRLFTDAVRQPGYAPDLAAALYALAFEHRSVAGTINVAGAQALTREAYGRALLDWFEIAGRERVTAGPAPSGVPLDLRLGLDRARSLGLDLRGVDEVLAAGG